MNDTKAPKPRLDIRIVLSDCTAFHSVPTIPFLRSKQRSFNDLGLIISNLLVTFYFDQNYFVHLSKLYLIFIIKLL